VPETVDALKARYPGAEITGFGDGPDLSAALIQAIRDGRKVATTSAMRDYAPGEPMPEVGRRDIVLNWAGVPVQVIETLEMRRCTFAGVTEAMALAEGEDRDLDGWRAGHRAYCKRTGGFAPEMEVVWERFAVVEDLGAPSAAPRRAP
jgi:uncharacterized protein YhfF